MKKPIKLSVKKIAMDEVLEIIRSKTDSVSQVVSESLTRMNEENHKEFMEIRTQLADLSILIKTALHQEIQSAEIQVKPVLPKEGNV
jgi:hypothetical protein